jgi:hypothetical protein
MNPIVAVLAAVARFAVIEWVRHRAGPRDRSTTGLAILGSVGSAVIITSGWPHREHSKRSNPPANGVHNERMSISQNANVSRQAKFVAGTLCTIHDSGSVMDVSGW